MRSTHKPGCDYGIDYGIVAVFLLWIAALIMVLILLAVRNRGESLRAEDRTDRIWQVLPQGGAVPLQAVVADEDPLCETHAQDRRRRQSQDAHLQNGTNAMAAR
jgi:hypothetical protein